MPVVTTKTLSISLQEEISQIYVWHNSSLPPFGTEHASTIKEFYNNFIEPRLPKADTVIGWTKYLMNYVSKKDAVFAIRIFANWMSVFNTPSRSDQNLYYRNHLSGNNPYVLRRGFLTEFKNESFSYFFNDNDFAKYFMKMALDGFVPQNGELLLSLKNKSFPARFNPCCKEEKVKSAYDISARSPNIDLYLGHVVDSGMNFISGKNSYGLAEVCENFFPRGSYDDWDTATKVRTLSYNHGQKLGGNSGLDYLKAHFLRFTCPINYFLSPKSNSSKKYQQTGSSATVAYKNIAELKELQEYIIGRFSQLYGQVYTDYLNAIMWKKDNNTVEQELKRINSKLNQLGDTVIDLRYSSVPFNSSVSHNIPSPTKVSALSVSKKAPASKSSSGVGQLAKNGFSNRIPHMPFNVLNDLQDIQYCKNTFGIAFPVLSRTRTIRYYAESINGYYICSQWYERHRDRLQQWLNDNPLENEDFKSTK